MMSKAPISSASIPSIAFYQLHEEAIVPARALSKSVGFDISAFLLTETGRPNTAILPPHTTRMISTQIAVRPPPGYFVAVCSRSGLATRSIFVANAPGIIDPDYTGEIQILLFNGGHTTYYVKHEDRIAQLVLLPVTIFPVISIKNIPPPPTERGDAGFGSTGR